MTVIGPLKERVKGRRNRRTMRSSTNLELPWGRGRGRAWTWTRQSVFLESESGVGIGPRGRVHQLLVDCFHGLARVDTNGTFGESLTFLETMSYSDGPNLSITNIFSALFIERSAELIIPILLTIGPRIGLDNRSSANNDTKVLFKATSGNLHCL